METRLNTSTGSEKYSPRRISVEASPPKGVKSINLDSVKSYKEP